MTDDDYYEMKETAIRWEMDMADEREEHRREVEALRAALAAERKLVEEAKGLIENHTHNGEMCRACEQWLASGGGHAHDCRVAEWLANYTASRVLNSPPAGAE
jgi:hypothetical protein